MVFHARAQLLRGGPVRALPGHHQGPALRRRRPNDPRRRAAQTVCFEVLTALPRLLAPILTFTADEVWRTSRARGKPESVHLVTFPEERGEWLDERARRRVGAAARGAGRGLAGARGRAQAGQASARASTRSSTCRARPRRMAARCSRPRARPCSRRCSTSRACGSASAPAEATPCTYESQDIPGLVIEVVPARRGRKKCERCWTAEPARRRGPRSIRPSASAARRSCARSAGEPHRRADAARGPRPGPGHQGPGARAICRPGVPGVPDRRPSSR